MAKIELDNWQAPTAADTESQAALFNCDALAAANALEGNQPLRLRCDDRIYLAYRRDASLVVPAISTADMRLLLDEREQLRATAAPFGVRALSMNSFNAPSASLDDLRALVADSGNLRYEFVLAVADYVPTKISSNHRRNIKKAAKAGMVFRWSSGPEAVQAHLTVVNENLQDKGVGGLGNSVDYFCRLQQDGAGALAQVFDGADLVASTFLVVNDKIAYYHSSGTTAHGRKSGAAHYLVDQALQDLRERGLEQLNLGGATAGQGGLLRFKTGFRPQTRLLVASRCTLATGFLSALRTRLRPRREQSEAEQTLQASAMPQPAGEFQLLAADEQALVRDVLAHPELGHCLAGYWQHGGRCYRLLGAQDKLAAVLICDEQPGAQVALIAAGFTGSADTQAAGQAALPLLAAQRGAQARVGFNVRSRGDERLRAQFSALGFE